MGTKHTCTINRNTTVESLSITNADRLNNTPKKLLLLGTGSSGKRTLFLSLKMVTGDQNTDIEIIESRHVIRQNCVAGILTILKKSQELYDENPEKNSSCLVNMDDEIVSAIQFVVNYGSESFSEVLNYNEIEELGRVIYLLWSLDAVRATFDRRGTSYSFPDNIDYFFGKVREIMMENYSPTTEDYLKCRLRTTGYVEYKYDARDNEFELGLTGGQRNERKKWIHHFENVSAVLYVASLTHFNAVLFEDEKKNALHESIELWEEILHRKWFRKSEMILFLNKDDLFRDKLRLQIPLSVCFSNNVGWNGKQWNGPDYKPIIDDENEDKQHFEECYESAIQFIQDIFVSVNQNRNRVIFCHITVATDQDIVQKVFWDLQNIVIRSNLRNGPLIV